MYLLFIKQFFRTKTVMISFGMLILLGVLSLGTGKQLLNQKHEAISAAVEQQQKQIELQTKRHPEDLGLLLYYLKFSFIHAPNPLAGISIGQSDLNTHIQNINILNLEGQKYDTDLINPMRLHAGNLDLSFLIVFLFPLLIIVLTFDLLSEEIEKGTWTMICTQGTAPFLFLLKKLSIRMVFVFTLLGLLFLAAKYTLDLPLDRAFLDIVLIAYTYVLFWFVLCFTVVLFRKSSNTNAMLLLSLWLFLVVLFPVAANNYIIHSYPIQDAYTMTIKQRDQYHKKWDTDKKETLQKFYTHYPQFRKYGFLTEGFSWLWYYAMQQMGDDESIQEQQAMYKKIKKRMDWSTQIAKFCPPMQVWLSMNEMAHTGLSHQIAFWKATTTFHEDLRLSFYPAIFENKSAYTVDWDRYKSTFFQSKSQGNRSQSLWPIVLSILGLLVVIFVKKRSGSELVTDQ